MARLAKTLEIRRVMIAAITIKRMVQLAQRIPELVSDAETFRVHFVQPLPQLSGFPP